MKKETRPYIRDIRLAAAIFGAVIVCCSGTGVAKAATLYLYPSDLQIVKGESAVFDIRLNTEGQPMNTVNIMGASNNGNAVVAQANPSNSVLQIFVEQPKVTNGGFSFVGGVPNGFTGDGVIGQIIVDGASVGTSDISFSTSSFVLANSGEGQVLPLKYGGATVSVVGVPSDYIQITSRTNPDQSKWYPSKDVNIHWDLEKGAQYSYTVSQDPTAVPDNVPDRPSGTLIWMGDISLSGLNDGIYYFTVKNIASSTVSRYRIMKDATPPDWVEARVDKGTTETGGKSFVSFLAKDSTSGIDHYDIQVDGGDFTEVTSPYILQEGSYRNIVLRAYDKAGNMSEDTLVNVSQSGTSSPFSLWAVFAVVVLVMLFVAGLWRFIARMGP